MTASQACDILNAHAHRGHDNWYASGESDRCLVNSKDSVDTLTGFEAIAVAQRYIREAKP